MTFTEHLAELRDRIIRSAIFLAVAMILCYIFSEQMFLALSKPINDSGAGAEWEYFNFMENVLVSLKLAMYGGLVLSLPYIVYQGCAFIFPGLRPKERKVIQTMLAGCSVLAVAGVCVAYWGIFPIIMPYLNEMAFEGVTLKLRLSENVSLILMMFVGFAVAFQFPMIVLVLVYMDLLSPATLKKQRRVAIVIMALVSMVLTPPDPISMMIMLTPLLFLYEISILLSYLVVRRRAGTAS